MSSTQEKTALLVGATGLVGSQLLRLLLSDDRYAKVIVFNRRKAGVSHPKLIEHIVKFDELPIWKHLLVGDELYSVLGTTIKKAGSQNAQWKIDYDHQFNVARASAKNGVQSLGLVSSLGASKKSKNFYLAMKGKLDKDVQNLRFKKVLIIRPSFLKGKRNEDRVLERIGIFLANIFTILPGLRKYKPIHAKKVAEALINGLNDPSSNTIYEGEKVFELV